MAAGEYVSVYTQADTEKADLDLEKKALAEHPVEEQKELAAIYVERGLEPELAAEVARQLMDKDALEAHARDEIGISKHLSARPVQAAVFSAASFSLGAALPLVLAAIVPTASLIPVIAVGSLFLLGLLGAAAAQAGGASIYRGALRVMFWGAAAMAATAIIGKLFGTTVA